MVSIPSTCLLDRIDEIVGTLAILSIAKAENDVNSKMLTILSSDHDIERRTILYRNGVSKGEVGQVTNCSA